MESQPSTSTSSEELPQCFNVRYLGFRDADGLWGIKYTRKPVDNMVAAVKTSNSKNNLHLIKFIVTQKGCKLESVFNDKIETREEFFKKNPTVFFFERKILLKNSYKLMGMTPISVFVEKYFKFFPIESISYGVQDLVYTRVFAMIIVKEIADQSSESVFECHAFVCDSRQSARKLTYSLATAFHQYSRQLRAAAVRPTLQKRKLFAIDLRTPEEIARQIKYQDSEA